MIPGRVRGQRPRQWAALLLFALLAFGLAGPASAQEIFVRGQVDGLAVAGDRLFWKAGCGDDFTPPRSYVRSAAAAAEAPLRTPTTHFNPEGCTPDRVASRNLAADSAHVYWITGDRRLVRIRQDRTGSLETLLEVPGRGEDSFLAVAGEWIVWTDGAAAYRVRRGGPAKLETVLRPGAVRERLGRISGRAEGYVVQAGDRLYDLIPLRAGGPFIATPIAAAAGASAFAESGGTVYAGVSRRGGGYSVIAIPREGPLQTLYSTSGRSPRERIGQIWVESGTVYWHASDESPGPVMRVPASGGGSSAMTRDLRISPESPMVVSSGYLFWTTNLALYRLPLASPGSDQARGDIWIEGVEWVQVVQTPGNEVPMVGGKPTAIRVYVRGRDDSNGPWISVSAQLRVEGSGRIHRAGPIRVPTTGSDRKRLTDSFLFTLAPEETRPGPRRMTVTLVPPDFRRESDAGNNVRSFQVQFSPRMDLRLHAFTWRTVNSAACAARNPPFPPPADGAVSSWDHVLLLGRSAANILPLSSVTMVPISGAGTDTFDDSDCNAYLRAQAFLKVDIDRLFPDERVIAVLINPPSENRDEQGWCCDPSRRGSTTLRVNNPQGPSTVLPHELVHHYYKDSHPPDSDFGYPSARRPATTEDQAPIGDIVGMDFSSGAPVLVVGQDASGTSLRSDLMNYRLPDWISLFTYCKALKGISRGATVCPASVEGGGP